MIPDITPAIKAMGWIIAISVPLAAWKAIEIAVWIVRHINISFQ